MNDVEFEEEVPEQFLVQRTQKEKSGFVIEFIIDTGIVKSERQANIVLVIITLVAFSAAGFITANTLFIKQQPHLETFTLPQKTTSNP